MTQNAPFQGLTGPQRKAAFVLVEGGALDEAAARAGVNRRTLRRWRHNNVFREALRAASSDIFDTASARLRGLTERAVTVLADALGGEAGPGQIKSATFIIEHCSQLSLAEVEERLTALEQAAGR